MYFSCSYEVHYRSRYSSWVGLPCADSDLCCLCLIALPFGTFVQARELEGHVLAFKCFGLEERHELITWPQLTARWLENVWKHMEIQWEISFSAAKDTYFMNKMTFTVTSEEEIIVHPAWHCTLLHTIVPINTLFHSWNSPMKYHSC